MLFVLLCSVCTGLGYLIWRSRQEFAMLSGHLAGIVRMRPELDAQPCSRIPERRALDPKAALEFYQRLHASPDWPVLAHKLQLDARQALLHCRTLADDGKGEAALFHAGVAHYASQLAVLPEREIQTALGVLKQQAAEAEFQKRNGQATETSRPARY
jgi:hypothetical protein